MAKPTGTTGRLLLGTDRDGKPIREFLKIDFPKEKAAIELIIAEGFLRTIGNTPRFDGDVLSFTDLLPNEENDFDFSVRVNQQLAYLELMEAAPLKSSYDEASNRFKPYDFAAHVLMGIANKHEKYPQKEVRDIYLLVYATHYAFMFSDLTFACIRYWLGCLPALFKGVFSYRPITRDEGLVDWLCPAITPDGFHPDQAIGSIAVNFDPRSIQVIQKEGEQGAMFAFPPIEERDR